MTPGAPTKNQSPHRALSHRDTEIIPPEHHPGREGLPLLTRIQNLPIHLYTHAHACIKPHTWTHGWLIFPPHCKETRDNPSPSHIHLKLLIPTQSLPPPLVFMAARSHGTEETVLPEPMALLGRGKVAQRMTSVSFWAGGQRRASHVQRQRGKHLCGRGSHKLGSRLCLN